MEAMELQALTHIYSPGTVYEKKALDHIDLTLFAGECVGIIGHTGSGKSTLVQHMNALLTPTSGRVLLNGEDIRADKKKLKQVRQQVGLVFQYPEHQLFGETVYEDVAFGPRNMGFSAAETDDRVREALTLVGLKESAYQKSPFELSGGQKRRAAIAGVLSMRPSILILDEPAAGLDPAGRDEILSHIKRTHAEMKNTVVLVSHSMEDVAKMADRIVIMSKGAIVSIGTPAEVFAQEEMLTDIGLAVPQISRLMGKLARKGIDVPQGIFTVEEAVRVLMARRAADGPLTSVEAEAARILAKRRGDE